MFFRDPLKKQINRLYNKLKVLVSPFLYPFKIWKNKMNKKRLYLIDKRKQKVVPPRKISLGTNSYFFLKPSIKNLYDDDDDIPNRNLFNTKQINANNIFREQTLENIVNSKVHVKKVSDLDIIGHITPRKKGLIEEKENGSGHTVVRGTVPVSITPPSPDSQKEPQKVSDHFESDYLLANMNQVQKVGNIIGSSVKIGDQNQLQTRRLLNPEVKHSLYDILKLELGNIKKTEVSNILDAIDSLKGKRRLYTNLNFDVGNKVKKQTVGNIADSKVNIGSSRRVFLYPSFVYTIPEAVYTPLFKKSAGYAQDLKDNVRVLSGQDIGKFSIGNVSDDALVFTQL